MPLNRHSALRENEEWLQRQLDAENAQFLILCKDTNLVRYSGGKSTAEAVFLDASAVTSAIRQSTDMIYLGQMTSSPVFALDLGEMEKPTAQEWIDRVKPGAVFMDLRHVGMLLSRVEAAILAYARGISFWHRHHRFCSYCGRPLHPFRGGHMKKCPGPSCARETYPRIEPAVIMLVEQRCSTSRRPQCLLGRHAGLPGNMYSTLAGYVDLGETLEEAVIREVKEEAGISVNKVRYVTSQPWPFPSSMMLGFQAQAIDTCIDITHDNLEDAQWFTLDQVLDMAEYDDSHSGPTLPRKDSIAYTLIQLWIRCHRVQ